MEKPVRITGNDKIRTFNEKVRNGIEHALNFMLGPESTAKIQVTPFEPFLMPIEAYINSYKKKSVLIKLLAENAFTGELYWFFEMKTALVLGGLLRMLAPASLVEKVNQGTFDASDQDAFGEVGNQLSGILDRAFRTLTNKNIHLRMDFDKKVYPDEKIKVESFLNREEYVVLLCSITIPNFGTEKLTLLLPRTLYEVLLNLEIELEGIQPKSILVYSWDPARSEKLQADMNSRYTKVISVDKPDELLNKLEVPNLTAIALDFKVLSFPLAHQYQILLKRFLANRSFMRIPLFLSWENNSAEGVAELQKMGFTGATTASLLTDFPKWAAAFTMDTSRKQ